MANYIISSGETSTGIVLNNGDNMTVQNGGYAVNTVVSSGGSLLVLNGGIASGVTTAQYGRITVSSGGTLYMSSWGAGVSGLTVEGGAYASLGSGIEIKDMTIKASGRIYLSDVVSATNMHVESGAIINGLKMEAEQIFESALVFSSIVITPGTSAYFNNGQKGVDITITSGGYLLTNNGAVADNVTVSSGAVLAVNSGANAKHVSVLAGAGLSVNSGASLESITVSSGGIFFYAPDAQLTSIGFEAGARINNIALVNAISADSLESFVISGGIVSAMEAAIYSGQVASDITVLSGGSLTIQNGTTMKGLVVSSGARLQILGGAVLEDMNFMSGAYVNNIRLAEDAAYESMDNFVITGGTVVGNGNYGYLYFGQSAVDTLVESYTRLYVSSGARADNTEVFGSVYLSNGGVATDTVVQSGGFV